MAQLLYAILTETINYDSEYDEYSESYSVSEVYFRNGKVLEEDKKFFKDPEYNPYCPELVSEQLEWYYSSRDVYVAHHVENYEDWRLVEEYDY